MHVLALLILLLCNFAACIPNFGQAISHSVNWCRKMTYSQGDQITIATKLHGQVKRIA